MKKQYAMIRVSKSLRDHLKSKKKNNQSMNDLISSRFCKKNKQV
jgi:hypothetical protein